MRRGLDGASLGQIAETFEVFTDLNIFWSFTNGQSYHLTGFFNCELLFFISKELK